MSRGEVWGSGFKAAAAKWTCTWTLMGSMGAMMGRWDGEEQDITHLPRKEKNTEIKANAKDSHWKTQGVEN